MITRLGLLDIAASPSCSLMVWSKVTEGEACIKTLGQQVLRECCQLCFMPMVCCFSRVFLVNFRSVVPETSASGVSLLPDIFLCTSAARRPHQTPSFM